jgi:hypothetical protein
MTREECESLWNADRLAEEKARVALEMVETSRQWSADDLREDRWPILYGLVREALALLKEE